MRKWAAIAVSAAMTIAAVPASAATMVFDLTGNTSTSGTAGNSRIFSATDGTTTIQVRATAWSATPLKSGGYSISKAYLGDYSYGLGVTAAGDGNGSNNEHTIDNKGSIDFVVLQFSQVVQVGNAALTPFSISGSIDNDSTIGIGSTSAAWNSAVNFTDLSLFGNFYDLYGNGRTSTIDINPNGFQGNLLLVGASFDNDRNYDGFKLGSLTVSTVPPPAVPEPATWAMMIGGMALVGTAMRRRRRIGHALA